MTSPHFHANRRAISKRIVGIDSCRIGTCITWWKQWCTLGTVFRARLPDLSCYRIGPSSIFLDANKERFDSSRVLVLFEWTSVHHLTEYNKRRWKNFCQLKYCHNGGWKISWDGNHRQLLKNPWQNSIGTYFLCIRTLIDWYTWFVWVLRLCTFGQRCNGAFDLPQLFSVTSSSLCYGNQSFEWPERLALQKFNSLWD